MPLPNFSARKSRRSDRPRGQVLRSKWAPSPLFARAASLCVSADATDHPFVGPASSFTNAFSFSCRFCVRAPSEFKAGTAHEKAASHRQMPCARRSSRRRRFKTCSPSLFKITTNSTKRPSSSAVFHLKTNLEMIAQPTWATKASRSG